MTKPITDHEKAARYQEIVTAFAAAAFNAFARKAGKDGDEAA